MRQLAFWDTSALVPLCVPQVATPRLSVLSDTYDAAVWWATPVELASALARLERLKEITGTDAINARRLAKGLADWWYMIDPSDELRSQAIRLVDRYDLRAADSLQLAAALEWCGDVPQGHVFLAADRRLREAALLSGFDAQQI